MESKITNFNVLIDLLRLIYPRYCIACEDPLVSGENVICLACHYQLPKYKNDQKNSEVERIFWGRLSVEYILSYLEFEKGNMVQQLLFELKYRNRKDVGTAIGNWLANSIKESISSINFDCIVPVPLHITKLRKRGYNQSEVFGRALSENLTIPIYTDVVKRINAGTSQTTKSRFNRWVNVASNYKLTGQSKIANKHVLLVDDVLTTGSTLEAVGLELLRSENVKISIATIAITKH